MAGGLHAVRETQPGAGVWVSCHLTFQPSGIWAPLSCCVSLSSKAPCLMLLVDAATSELYPHFVQIPLP